MNGILPHKYINASDDIAAYMADQCGRQAVTAEFAYEHLCDVTLYVFQEEMGAQGFDPWVTVEGMDKGTKTQEYFLDYGRTGVLKVAPDFRVFVSKKMLAKIIPAPESFLLSTRTYGKDTAWRCLDFSMAASIINVVQPDTWEVHDEFRPGLTEELKTWMKS
jgi:hypothetical protein